MNRSKKGDRVREAWPIVMTPEQIAEADQGRRRARELLVARHEVSQLEELLHRARQRLAALQPSTMFD